MDALGVHVCLCGDSVVSGVECATTEEHTLTPRPLSAVRARATDARVSERTRACALVSSVSQAARTARTNVLVLSQCTGSGMGLSSWWCVLFFGPRERMVWCGGVGVVTGARDLNLVF